MQKKCFATTLKRDQTQVGPDTKQQTDESTTKSPNDMSPYFPPFCSQKVCQMALNLVLFYVI
jgi:hypothetical protein